MNGTVGHCASCNEPIFWLKSDATGKLAPIEVKTDPNGNVLITERLYHVVTVAEAREKHRGSLHLNHFVTCPQKKAWKKAGGRHP